MRRIVVFACGVVLLCGAAFAQNAQVVTPPEQKFATFPGIPECTKGAVLHGDPASDQGAVLMLKATAGCKIPWHWHTSTEQLGLVSGSAKLEMKDGGAKTLTPGTYVFMPSKHQHQFTCPTACTLFLATEAKFDIHYVDASGNEIPPDQALKPKGASGTRKAPAKGKSGD